MAILMLRRSPQGYAPVRVALIQMGKQVKLGKKHLRTYICLLLTLLQHPADKRFKKKKKKGERRRDFKMFHADFNICDFFYTMSVIIFRFSRFGNCRYATNSHLTQVKQNLCSNQVILPLENSSKNILRLL